MTLNPSRPAPVSLRATWLATALSTLVLALTPLPGSAATIQQTVQVDLIGDFNGDVAALRSGQTRWAHRYAGSWNGAPMAFDMFDPSLGSLLGVHWTWSVSATFDITEWQRFASGSVPADPVVTRAHSVDLQLTMPGGPSPTTISTTDDPEACVTSLSGQMTTVACTLHHLTTLSASADHVETGDLGNFASPGGQVFATPGLAFDLRGWQDCPICVQGKLPFFPAADRYVGSYSGRIDLSLVYDYAPASQAVPLPGTACLAALGLAAALRNTRRPGSDRARRHQP